jgi:hypothetical protein
VLTGEQMQRAPERHRPEIAKRFTEAAVELYGEPNVPEVRRLAAEQYHNLARNLDDSRVDQDRLKRVLSFLENQLGGVPPRPEIVEDELHEPLEQIGIVFEERYGEALAVFDEIDYSQKQVPAEKIKELFEKAKDTLAHEDPEWNNQKVVLTDKKSMGYDDKKHQIGIGKKGTYAPKRIKRLFIEEALVHGLRTLNGSKSGDYMLEHGLPGYLAAEEGLAKFLQVAMGDEIGERTTDFYVDTAFALGQLGQKPLARPELADLYIDRMIVREQAKQKEIDMPKLHDDAWRYANRIYRGSLGNEHVAVNTKDIAYYQGFIQIGHYIKERLAEGTDAGVLLDYLLSCRFDPTNQRHAAYVSQFVKSPLNPSSK